jgi:hypothetical protein
LLLEDFAFTASGSHGPCGYRFAGVFDMLALD